jgi:hypothetical protein
MHIVWKGEVMIDGVSTKCEACGKDTDYVIIEEGKAYFVCKRSASCDKKIRRNLRKKETNA